MALYQLSCYSSKEEIHLTNYADLIISDMKGNLIGLRFGGYPEQVTAMADAITAGCSIDVYKNEESFCITSRYKSDFSRKTTYDGIYAECVIFLKDSDIDKSANDVGEEDVAPPKTIYLYCRTDSREELFEELDRKLSVPLISDFRDYLIDELLNKNMLEKLIILSESMTISAYKLKFKSDEKDIVKILGDGLKSGKIKIPGDFKGEDIFRDIKGFSDYLKNFGKLIAEHIKESFVPLFDPEKEKICSKLCEVNEYVKRNAKYELFDAQLAAAEGLKRELDKSKLALLIAECGSGKTKIGSAALYAHQNSTKKLGKPKNKPSFNVVVCPSHVCEKWVRELHETIPNCYAKVIENFTDVDKLYEIFKTGKESIYCVISKEKARDGYMKEPAVVWSKVKKAFVCPDCGATQMMSYTDKGSRYMVNADSAFYLRETNLNHKCIYCGTVLWSAINPDCLSPSKIRLGAASSWVKISDYGFVHRNFVNEHLTKDLPEKYREEMTMLYENPNAVIPTKGAYRRYPLSLYIKKHIKHLDGLIVDELHQYTGDSGQGQAMADLSQIAKKVVGMTATLINGYSKGMFYLLFRLASRLMLLDEQLFRKSTDFCRRYGVVEKKYEIEIAKVNSMSRNTKSRVREKFLPGVSPLVYTRFLLDNAVFLSLVDMGKELPDYEEIPISVKMSDEIEAEYSRLQKDFVTIIKCDKRLSQKLMSTYLNLLTAYPDQPYGHLPVHNPLDEEEILIEPKDIGDINCVLPKDEAILKLVGDKVNAGERVIIYTAWTRLDTQVKLHRLLTESGYHVKILDSNIPAKKREAWVDKQVRDGIEVLIVNPACVETGLDLNDFTTLIFYNLAFNLYIFRQASRRSWRINQTAPKVEVYMFYYEHTLQHKALKLMAAKLSAATIIEGGISDEGLAALSECEDMTSRMAKELAAGIKDSVENLSETFKRMALIKENTNGKADANKNAVAKQTLEPQIKLHKTPDAKDDEHIQYSLFDLMAG